MRDLVTDRCAIEGGLPPKLCTKLPPQKKKQKQQKKQKIPPNQTKQNKTNMPQKFIKFKLAKAMGIVYQINLVVAFKK